MNKYIVSGVVVVLVVCTIVSIFSLTHTKLQIVSTDTPTPETSTPALYDEFSTPMQNQDAAAAGSKRQKTAVATATSALTAAFVPTASAAQLNSLKVMAWIYPGNPACAASTEYADGRRVDVLKAEFFTISGGILTLLDTTNTRCNGYSPATISRLKQYSSEQYTTVSSASTNDMETFFVSALAASSTDIATLVNFTVENGLTGIELDFEDFSSWSPQAYSNYKQFVSVLGNALHAEGKKLMIDGPAVSNATEEKWFLWRYSDFVNLPVDTIVVMAYDYQYDYGAGAPVAPLDWLRNVITWTATKYPIDKLAIGLPSYGYQGPKGSYRITILTYEQIRKKTGFATAKRDPRSGEMTWQSGSTVYFYQDAESLRQKRDVAASLGVSAISVWHLGGNQWF
jgi:spore germination protein YaaH